MLSELGTPLEDEVAFSRRIGTQTGGLSVSYTVTSLPSQPDEVSARLLLRGKSLSSKAGELFAITSDMLGSTQLANQRRAVEMLRDAISQTESSVISSGSAYASARIASQFTLQGYLSEQMGGLSQLHTLRALLAEAEGAHTWPALLARLEGIRAAVLTRDSALVNLTSDAPSLAAAQHHAAEFVQRLPAAAAPLQPWARTGAAPLAAVEGLQVPTQVQYVAKGCPVYAAGEAPHGSSAVVARYLGNSYLWENVRVLGGAYGCSLGFDRFTGMATYSSYRDPNLTQTLDNYDGTAAFLRGSDLSEAELTKAVVGQVGEMDAPFSADQKGYTSMVRHLLGITDSDRQLYRDQVLATSRADFVSFAERLDRVRTEGHVCVVGSEAAFAEAAPQLPGLAVERVL